MEKNGDIKAHHDARYPFVWFQTTEEERIIRENRAKFPDEVNFFSWDIAAGFQLMRKNGGDLWVWDDFTAISSGKKVVDPKAAVNLIQQLPENSLMFLKDFHKFFESISVSRETLNLKPSLKTGSKTICFLSATKAIPVELANDITVLDYAYPSESELLKVLERIASDNGMKMPENSEVVVNAMKGLTWEGAENALCLSLVIKGFFDIKTILDQKAALLKAGGVLEYGNFKETLDELYGLEVMKEFVIKTFASPKSTGIIIYGAPGAGKSAFAKAVANHFGIPCLILRFSSLKDKYQGVAEGRLRDAFHNIRAFGNCVVFVDEIESICSGISSGGDSGVGMALFKDLLVEIEDSKGCGAKWIGTCNDLTPIIKESGGALISRMDAVFFADVPTRKEESMGIAKIWSKKEGIEIPETFDLTGYSGRNIAKLAEKMSMMNCSADEAAKYVIPYGKAYASELEEIRRKAKEVCIWASSPEKPQPMGVSERKIKRGAV
jgi:hypothetical protein